ncbi:FAD-dependent oxidoreductase [Tistrella mobilis]|uniref:NAD(P)/FAD-dependent oxidoreductase n=1 Tax=Tistrella mobilis TaxID=171437 RepID=UPI0031F65417
MTWTFDIAIAGAGHAGAQLAISLRQGGFAGTIGLISAEHEAPYDRPSLTKDYLTGAALAADIRLRPDGFWAERNITRVPGTRITDLDPAAHRLFTADGRRIGYGRLAWATGGAARRLTCPGADLSGIHTIRSLADADRLRADLSGRPRVVVVGAGYVGLEAAAALVGQGHRVTVVEAADRVLARVSGRSIAAAIEARHRDAGVEIRTGVGVEALTGDAAGRVAGVVLSDGDCLPADLVIVGIGLVPEVSALAAAGATTGAEAAGGVAVDGLCRTGLPDVWALGDCAAHVNRFAGGRRVRLECVQNAVDQARVVAGAMLGGDQPYDAVPRFWSSQYDIKLQTIGIVPGHDTEILRGRPESGSFSAVYLRDGRVVAIDCVNAPLDFAQGRGLIQAQADALAPILDPAALADPARPLKTLQTGTVAVPA